MIHGGSVTTYANEPIILGSHSWGSQISRHRNRHPRPADPYQRER
jgi:hypothetical protein